MGNIAPIMHALERDALCRLVYPRRRLLQRWTNGNDAEHAPTRSDELPVFERGSGVKYLHIGQLAGLLDQPDAVPQPQDE